MKTRTKYKEAGQGGGAVKNRLISQTLEQNVAEVT